MRQETGKTNQSKVKSLSVQISLNGQAFLYRTIEGVRYGESYDIDSLLSYVAQSKITELTIFLAQNKYVALPKELFLENQCDTYLRAKYSSLHNIVLNDITDDIAIVYPMLDSLNSEIIKLEEICEVLIYHSFSTLIFLTKNIEQDNISFSYINNHMYVVAKKENQIKFIECFEIEDEINIIDMIEIISRKFDMSNASVAWTGELSPEITDILKKHYNIV